MDVAGLELDWPGSGALPWMRLDRRILGLVLGLLVGLLLGLDCHPVLHVTFIELITDLRSYFFIYGSLMKYWEIGKIASSKWEIKF